MEDVLVDATGTRAVRGADAVGARPAAALDLSQFEGRWLNADARTTGLAQVVCSVANGRLAVRASGGGTRGPIGWDEARDVVVYAAGVTAGEGSGFTARYDFPHLSTRMQANLKGGVMVAVTYNTFTDGSGRRPYFMREFLTLGAPA